MKLHKIFSICSFTLYFQNETLNSDMTLRSTRNEANVTNSFMPKTLLKNGSNGLISEDVIM